MWGYHGCRDPYLLGLQELRHSPHCYVSAPTQEAGALVLLPKSSLLNWGKLAAQPTGVGESMPSPSLWCRGSVYVSIAPQSFPKPPRHTVSSTHCYVMPVSLPSPSLLSHFSASLFVLPGLRPQENYLYLNHFLRLSYRWSPNWHKCVEYKWS